MRAAVARVVEQTQGDDVRLLIYGQQCSTNTEIWLCPVHWLGPVRDDRVLALAYSAADVMVVPSRQEAFGQTASEAQACGTPVVAFEIGGLPDIVEHGQTGWLAPASDIERMAEGIRWVLSQRETGWLAKQARERAVARFSNAVVAESYKAVYRSVLSG